MTLVWCSNWIITIISTILVFNLVTFLYIWFHQSMIKSFFCKPRNLTELKLWKIQFGNLHFKVLQNKTSFKSVDKFRSLNLSELLHLNWVQFELLIYFAHRKKCLLYTKGGNFCTTIFNKPSVFFIITFTFLQFEILKWK